MQDTIQSTTQYTRCPQCETAFKVTSKMLSMAKGKVRCGACLAVFQATDYLLQPSTKNSGSNSNRNLETEQSNETTDDSEQEEDPHPDKEKAYRAQDIEAELAQISSPLKSSTDVDKTDRIEPSLNTTQEISVNEIDVAVDKKNAQLESEITSELDEAHIEPEELFACQLDFELPEEEELHLSSNDSEEVDDLNINELENIEVIPEESAVEEGTLETSDLEIATIEEKPFVRNIETFQESDVLEEANQNTEKDNNVSEDLEGLDSLDEIENDYREGEDRLLSKEGESKLSISQQSASELASTRITDTTLSVITEFESEKTLIPDLDTLEMEIAVSESDEIEHQVDIELSGFDLDQAPNVEQIRDDEKLDSLINQTLTIDEDEDFELLADNLASQIQETDTSPDPLDEFEHRVEEKHSGLRNGIIASVILIVLAIVSLQFWNNRQQLAWDESWGETTLAMCSILPCDLKPRRDVSKIRLRQRIVTPSENKENSLDVKILLTNEANFEQPYPDIIIKFSNSDGNSVAEKRFNVKEYFPEKVDKMMPAGTEIHISFETEQPHPDALGFEFDFE